MESNNKSKMMPQEIGDRLIAHVNFVQLVFPKKPINQIDYGEFAILKVRIKDIMNHHITKTEDITDFFDSCFKYMVGENEVITIKGEIPSIDNWNATYYFEGVLEENAKFGYQYKIVQLHKEYSLDTEQEKRSFLTLLIGETKTDLLYKNFIDPIAPLREKNVQALMSVKGIGKLTANLLIQKYEENMEEALSAAKLQEYGLSLSIINKIRKAFPSMDMVLNLLSTNPYYLIEVVDGIGWEKADAIALNGGLSPTGENRVKGYIKYFLQDQAYGVGHSWVDLDYLVRAIKSKIPELEDETLREYLRSWVNEDEKTRWLYYDGSSRRIGLYYYYKIEKQVAWELMRIKHGNTTFCSESEIEEAISTIEKQNEFEYTEEQKLAIKGCLNNSVYILSGSAGTGKTFSMKPVVEVLKKHNKSFAQCALSGKASSNLSEITMEEGYTIHRLLGYDSISNSFQHNEERQLSYDVIILDELSLVGGEIFLSLLKAIPTGSKLIMLGDPNQLEAIGLANLLKDCIGSGVISYTCLSKIHRQAARSGIITESLRASAGEKLVSLEPVDEVRGYLKDLHVVTYSDSVLSQPKILEEFNKLYKEQNISVKDISIVVPMRTHGDISCLVLNNRIQAIVNGIPTEQDYAVNSKEGGYILRPLDKILITRNHYQAGTDEKGETVPIFNGNTGYIVSIDIENETMVVDLVQQGRIKIGREYWSDIELGYALTCHKMQGSSSPYIIVGIDMGAYTLLSKEWLYTSLTRAKKYCSLVGQISAIRKAATISRVTVKQTWLKEFLNEMEYEKTWTNERPYKI